MTKTNANQPSNERKNVLIILDDCMSDIDFNQSKSLKKICTCGRHFNLSIIATCQYLNSLPKICRSNHPLSSLPRNLYKSDIYTIFYSTSRKENLSLYSSIYLNS